MFPNTQIDTLNKRFICTPVLCARVACGVWLVCVYVSRSDTFMLIIHFTWHTKFRRDNKTHDLCVCVCDSPTTPGPPPNTIYAVFLCVYAQRVFDMRHLLAHTTDTMSRYTAPKLGEQQKQMFASQWRFVLSLLITTPRAPESETFCMHHTRFLRPMQVRVCIQRNVVNMQNSQTLYDSCYFETDCILGNF